MVAPINNSTNSRIILTGISSGQAPGGSQQSTAPAPYHFQLYPYNTIEAEEDIYQAHRLFQNLVIKPVTDNIGLPGSALGRIGTDLLINFPLGIGYQGVTHEFGHASRYAEAGCSPSVTLWPLSDCHTDGNCGKDLSLKEQTLAQAGGFEATQFISNKIAQNMFVYGTDEGDYIFYVSQKIDTAYYIIFGHDPASYSSPYDKHFPEDNDVANYWRNMMMMRKQQLVKQYGLEKVASKDLWDGPGFSYDAVRAGAYLDALDPTLLFLTYQQGKYYLTGEKPSPIPNFLPRTAFIPSINGPEYYVWAPFRDNGIVFDPYFRIAVNKDGNSYGGGLDVLNIPFGARTILNAGVDLWQQKDRFGFMAESSARIKITDKIGVDLGAFYKTYGYVMAKGLDNGLGFNVGVSITP